MLLKNWSYETGKIIDNLFQPLHILLIPVSDDIVEKKYGLSVR